MQYTLRNIPKHIDRALRERARASGKSLNEAAIEALQRGLDLNAESKRSSDLDWFLGSGGLEPKVLRAIAEHDEVHPDDWK
jgi:plasmid stability protein